MTRPGAWHGTSFASFNGNLRLMTARNRAWLLSALLLRFALPRAAGAQTQLIVAKPGETLPSLEVAAIRPDNAGPYHTSVSINDDSYRAENLTVRDLISRGWDTRARGQIEGGPGSLMDERFDVNARIDPDDVARLKKLSHDERGRQVALMIQKLLAERFHLVAHIESKEMPVYALVLTKGGPRFHVSESSSPSKLSPASAQVPQKHGDGFWIRSDGKHASLTAYGSTMDGLADALSNQPETTGRYVINKTGLGGRYDFALEWTPEYLRAALPSASASGAADPAPVGPSLFPALQDQLGLKLVSEKAPVQVLVIDHVEPPSAN